MRTNRVQEVSLTPGGDPMQRIRMKKLGRSGRFWWAGPAQGFLRPGLYVLTGPGRQIRLLPVRTRPQHL